MNVEPEKIQAMISILQSMLESENNPKEIQDAPQQKAKEVSFVTKKESFASHINKFDKMIEKNMHKEDIAIDQKLNTQPPIARSRTYNPISVKCRVCGKQEQISPQLIPSAELERYKCNKCSSSPG